MVTMLYTLVHEYTHSVAFRKYDYYMNWTTEALCNYFNMLTEYGRGYMDQYLFYREFYALTDTNPIVHENKEFVLNYLSSSNKPYTNLEYIDAAAYINPKSSPLTIENYRSAYTLIFLAFIVNNYGMDKVIALYAEASQFIDTIGKTENQVITEWQQYLSDKYETME